MNPGSYLPTWNDAFNPFRPTSTGAVDLSPPVVDRFRLAQAQALRVWCSAKAREWERHAPVVRDSLNEWAVHVPAEVRQAQVQDMLSRALNAEGGAAALPVLLGLGASLLDPHPSFDPKYHPMHVALQPSHCNGKVLGAVLAHLPPAPFANGADPFPGWPRDHALQTFFGHQFGQKAWERARALGLDPSPQEQAILMSSWLRQKQRKRCTIALEEWGWAPSPTALLMDSWWSGHAWDNDQPDRLHAFDRRWLERFADRLPFSPVMREMAALTALPSGARNTGHQLLQNMDNVVRTFQRMGQWLVLAPPVGNDQALALETFETITARVNDWQAQWVSPSGVADQQKLEARVLRLELDQQAIRDRLQGNTTGLTDRARPRL